MIVPRVLGLKEESEYGEDFTDYDDDDSVPDFHRRVSDGSFKLNDDPVTYKDGSRMVQGARVGAVKPTGSTSGKCDLERIGHFLKAFFDQYRYTANGGTTGYHKHEFWGSESQDLHSFHLWATFDLFEKQIKGALLNTLKFEVSDDYMSQSEEWMYQNEFQQNITESTFTFREVEGEIPVMFYDVKVNLNNMDVNTAPIYTSFSFEGKNNLNQDGTIGMGDRFPQRKASAQSREISLSLKTYLGSSTIGLIRGAEYGDTTQLEPHACKIFKVPLKVTIEYCENSNDKLEMFFPECTISVEYSASSSDEIETSFNLTGLGTGDLTKFNEFTADTNPLKDSSGNAIKTDCYCKLINHEEEIKPIEDTSSNSSSYND